MNDHDQLREPMWDLIYGLLSEDESAELIDRIKSDPQAARLYAEVRLQADLVAGASRIEDSSLVLSVEKPSDISRPAPRSGAGVASASSRPKRFADRRSGDDRHGQPRGGKWLAGLVGLALALLIAAGIFWPQPDGPALAKNFVVTEIEAPQPLQAGLEGGITIRTRSLEGEPRPAQVALRVVASDGRLKYRQSLQTGEAGQTALTIPGDVLQPGVQFEIDAAPPAAKESPQVAEVADQDGLHLQSEFATSLFATLPIEPEPVLSYVLIEKPVAEAGKDLNFAVWNFGAYSGKPVDKEVAVAPVESATGAIRGTGVVAQAEGRIPGVATGRLPLPEATESEEYNLAVLDPRGTAEDRVSPRSYYGRYRRLDARARQRMSQADSEYRFEPREAAGAMPNVVDAIDAKAKVQFENERVPDADSTVASELALGDPKKKAQQVAPGEPEESSTFAREYASPTGAVRGAMTAGSRSAVPLAPPSSGKELQVKLNRLQAQYKTGERVQLELQVTDEAGQPAPGALVGVRVWHWNEQVSQVAGTRVPHVLFSETSAGQDNWAAPYAAPEDKLAELPSPLGRVKALATTEAPRESDLKDGSSPTGGQAGQQAFEALGLSPDSATDRSDAASVAAGGQIPEVDAYGAQLAIPDPVEGYAAISTIQLSNRDAVARQFQEALAHARDARKEAVTALGGLLLFGGVIGVVLVVLLALFRMQSGARTTLPAIAIAAASIVVGIAWLGWMPKPALELAMAPPEAAERSDTAAFKAAPTAGSLGDMAAPQILAPEEAEQDRRDEASGLSAAPRGIAENIELTPAPQSAGAAEAPGFDQPQAATSTAPADGERRTSGEGGSDSVRPQTAESALKQEAADSSPSRKAIAENAPTETKAMVVEDRASRARATDDAPSLDTTQAGASSGSTASPPAIANRFAVPAPSRPASPAPFPPPPEAAPEVATAPTSGPEGAGTPLPASLPEPAPANRIGGRATQDQAASSGLAKDRFDLERARPADAPAPGEQVSGEQVPGGPAPSDQAPGGAVAGGGALPESSFGAAFPESRREVERLRRAVKNLPQVAEPSQPERQRPLDDRLRFEPSVSERGAGVSGGLGGAPGAASADFADLYASGESLNDGLVLGGSRVMLQKKIEGPPPSLFFDPQLVTDERGRVVIEFDMPEVAAEYRLLVDVLGEGRLGSVEHTLVCQPAADD